MIPRTGPVRVNAGDTICCFASDGDNVRRKRLDSSGTIHYLGLYERNAGNGADITEVITKYYVGLGRLLAFRKAGTLYYVGTDHLGSTIRVADSTFNAVDGQRYKPFGGDRDAGTNLKTDHKFTNQIEDASIGLYWYGFRAYDPYLNRFLQSDPILADLRNPQALNLYTYGLNNPLRYVDPSGLSSSNILKGWEDTDGDTDNECFSSGGGALGGNVVYVTCLNIFGQTVRYEMVRVGPVLVPVITISPMSPAKDGKGGKESRRSGKERATDVPSWARGKISKLPGETTQQAVERLLNEQYGKGGWTDKGPGSEYSKIYKAIDRK